MEESPLGGVAKPLPASNRAKRLARETSEQHIKVWNLGSINLRYVAVWRFTEVPLVGLLSMFVPLRTKYTGAAR